ncbi:hypothetical protein REPUB_Repub04eG0195700 [Reevesia pubescens]
MICKVHAGSSYDEIFRCLLSDRECNAIQLSHDLIDKLLHRFNDDWNSALGAFRWAASRPGYEHSPQAYDTMVEILGQMKQMDRIKDFLEEMHQGHHVTLNKIAKVMRRFAGAGQWENAVRIFDELETFGLEKNTDSMNLLLDTLCKEKNVEEAREIFLLLISHIAPDAHTFNIFIHGWCKINRVEEAQWTIQEMRDMVVTLLSLATRLSSSSTVAKKFEEALQIAFKMKTAGCTDTLFYNCLIHTLGRVGLVRDASEVFEVEMPKTGVAPNTSTYNCMNAKLCHHAQQQKALTLLQGMENLRI